MARTWARQFGGGLCQPGRVRTAEGATAGVGRLVVGRGAKWFAPGAVVDVGSSSCRPVGRGQDGGVQLDEVLEALQEQATDETGHVPLLVCPLAA